MTPLLFRNARIFDGTNAECAEGMYLRVSDGLIQEVSPKPTPMMPMLFLDEAMTFLRNGANDRLDKYYRRPYRRQVASVYAPCCGYRRTTRHSLSTSHRRSEKR